MIWIICLIFYPKNQARYGYKCYAYKKKHILLVVLRFKSTYSSCSFNFSVLPCIFKVTILNKIKIGLNPSNHMLIKWSNIFSRLLNCYISYIGRDGAIQVIVITVFFCFFFSKMTELRLWIMTRVDFNSQSRISFKSIWKLVGTPW